MLAGLHPEPFYLLVWLGVLTVLKQTWFLTLKMAFGPIGIEPSPGAFLMFRRPSRGPRVFGVILSDEAALAASVSGCFYLENATPDPNSLWANELILWDVLF